MRRPSRARPREAASRYLTSTAAPASSSCALIESASSWSTPSLTAFGAPSTRSFASLRPRPGDRADDLDHLDLLVAGAREDDVERRLLLGRGRAVAAPPARPRRRDRDRSGGGDAPLLLDLVLELDELEHGHLPELLEHRVDCCHRYSSSLVLSVVGSSALGRGLGRRSLGGLRLGFGSRLGLVASARSASAPRGRRLGGARPRRRRGLGRVGLPRPRVAHVSPCSSSCSMRASISPTRFCSGALTSPTTRRQRRDDRAEHLAAQHVDRRQLREALDVLGRRSPRPRARRRGSRAPASRAPRRRAPSRRRPGRRPLSMNAIAVGPSSSASSASAPAASAARRVSVFLTTREPRAVLEQLVAQPVDLRHRQAAVVGDDQRLASVRSRSVSSATTRSLSLLLHPPPPLRTIEPAGRRARRRRDVSGLPRPPRLGFCARSRAASCLSATGCGCRRL